MEHNPTTSLLDTGIHGDEGEALGTFAAVRALVKNPRVMRALRIAVSVGLLALLFSQIEWHSVLSHARHLHTGTIVLLIAALGVQLLVSAWKWQWALRIHELRFPYTFLTRVYLSGFFLNNFLPTSIGGDAYRIYRTLPETPPRSRAISAVLLERVVGICALLLLGLAAAIVLYRANALARAYVVLAVVGTGALLAVLAAIWMWPARWRNGAFMRSRWGAAITENIRTISHARGAWIPLIGISVLFQAQAILIIYALFHALEVSVDLPQAALIAAAAGVATVIPLSINGLGVVEASVAGMAVAVGVSYEAGLLVALLIRLLVIPLTITAGLLYAFEPVRAREISATRDLFSSTPEYRNLRRTG